jgi:hypothetical protein
MKRYSSAASLTLAVLTVLGLAGHASAGDQVPFHGRYKGVDTGTPLAPPFASATVEAEGVATHLGRLEFTQVVAVNTATGVGSGTFLLTAANGDTVFGTLGGQATFTPPNVLSIVEIATITGGTGRFAGATGGFTVARLKNTATGATIASFEGTISSPGS